MVRAITVTEYVPTAIPLDLLDAAAVAVLERDYSAYLHIEWPNRNHPDEWLVTSPGWIGIIPLGDDRQLVLEPRVPVRSVFAMLNVACDLRGMRWPPGRVIGATMVDLYDWLAEQFVRHVLTFMQQGAPITYREHRERLPFVRGRVDVARQAASGDVLHPASIFGAPTADSAENQILLAALHAIRRGPGRQPTTRHLLGQALRTLAPVVAQLPIAAAQCLGRRYTRRTAPYRPLHALAALFLGGGPLVAGGDRPHQPFLMHMPRLFERTVTGWLAQHLPAAFAVQAQPTVPLDAAAQFTFRPDIVIAAPAAPAPRWIIDTKYLPATQPSSEAIAQVLAYAHTLQSPEALLVYPMPPAVGLDATLQGIRVRSAVFAVGEALDLAGAALVAALGLEASSPASPDRA